MNGYVPQHGDTLWLTGLVLAMLLVLGFILSRVNHVGIARLVAWSVVIIATSLVERATRVEPAGLRMVLIILVLLWSMKNVVGVEARAADGVTLSPWRWAFFVSLWPGMQPALFAPQFRRPLAARGLAIKGLKRLMIGAVLISLSATLWRHARSTLGDRSTGVIATISLCTGLSLALHFGVFNLIAAAWRLVGIDAGTLFRDPMKSASLTEFWGRRWNLAFVEMTTLGVYRPLRIAAGPGVAMVAAFLFSGLLHELAISVPVRAGYGGPMAYFALHAGLIGVERRLERGGRPINVNRAAGRVWTFVWLVLPAPILFHRPFLEGCVWPLVGFTP